MVQPLLLPWIFLLPAANAELAGRLKKLLRALLLQAFYSARSERRLMAQVTYNMLFRAFVGRSMDAPVWDVAVFTKNRDRLLRGEVAGKLFAAALADPQVKPLLSSEHVSVDGTLVEAWASMKSFRPRDGSGTPPGPGRNGERDAGEAMMVGLDRGPVSPPISAPPNR